MDEMKSYGGGLAGGIFLYDIWNLSYGNVMAFGRSDRGTRDDRCARTIDEEELKVGAR